MLNGVDGTCGTAWIPVEDINALQQFSICGSNAGRCSAKILLLSVGVGRHPWKRTISEHTIIGSDRAGKRFSEASRNVSFAWLPSIKTACVCAEMLAREVGTRRFPRECDVM